MIIAHTYDSDVGESKKKPEQPQKQALLEISRPSEDVRYKRPPMHAFTPEALENGATFLNRMSNLPFRHRFWVDPSDVISPKSIVPIDNAD